MDDKTFIVSDGYNTSYMDALFTALFCNKSCMTQMLTQEPIDCKFIYLQELINNNFVSQINQGYSIDYSIINEIRNYSIICGWNYGYDDITYNHDVVKYYDFLSKSFDFGNMSFDITQINKQNNFETITTKSLNYILLNIQNDINIKNALNEWTTNNILCNTSEHCAYFTFKELPSIIAIYLNRISQNDVDIQKKIKFIKNQNKNQQDVLWILSSFICCSNRETKHYYSIIKQNEKWFMFDNKNMPSMIEININNDIIKNKIKKECILLFYNIEI